MAVSFTSATRHGWRLPPDGAKRASSSTLATSASATDSSRNSRTDPVVRIASRKSMRVVLAASDLGADNVERRAGLEPLDLLVAEGVTRLEVDSRTVGLDDLTAHVAAGHGGQVEHVDPVVLADLVVGVGIVERQRQQSLLLGVGLVDASKRAGEDHDAVAEPWLHRGVLARRALAVVAVADGD